MSTNWIGPRRVSRILSDFTVELEHLLTGDTAVVHVCRVNPYADGSVRTKAQMKEVADFTDRIWYSVEKMASKFSSAGKDLLPLVIPGSRSPSCSKRFPPRSAISSSTAASTRLFAVLALPSASTPTVGDCYAILRTAALVAAVALPDRAASPIWRHRRYQTMIPGRLGWTSSGRVHFNSLLLLAYISDGIWMHLEFLYDLIFLIDSILSYLVS